MAIIPYDSTRSALYTPGLATDFFSWDAELSEAALCAEMARLAYVKDVERLKTYLGRTAFHLVAAIGRQSGAQAFIAESVGEVVVAFRGTEADDPTDLVADGEFLKTAWPPPSGAALAHVGFAQQLDSCWGEVEERLSGVGKRVLFTGHSLGAALATLAASLRDPDYLATFGSPLVGDAALARSLQHTKHDRFVDCCDLVTRVPPEGLGYAHTGTLRYIDRHGRVSTSPSEAMIAADRRDAFLDYLPTSLRIGHVALRELADHAPINYLSGVMGNRLASSP
jgi:hypothetical protein